MVVDRRVLCVWSLTPSSRVYASDLILSRASRRLDAGKFGCAPCDWAAESRRASEAGVDPPALYANIDSTSSPSSTSTTSCPVILASHPRGFSHVQDGQGSHRGHRWRHRTGPWRYSVLFPDLYSLIHGAAPIQVLVGQPFDIVKVVSLSDLRLPFPFVNDTRPGNSVCRPLQRAHTRACWTVRPGS